MNFVQDVNVRNCLNKGLSFRLPQARNVGTALESIKTGIVDYIKNLSKKFNVPEVAFDN